MPEARLQRTRATLPAGYQFGDAIYSTEQRVQYPLATNARFFMRGRIPFGSLDGGQGYRFYGRRDVIEAEIERSKLKVSHA